MSKNKKEIRKQFRESVFTRDKYRCKCCNVPGFDRQGSDLHLKFHKNEKVLVELDAHHIQPRTDDNYVKANGISLCPECHIKAEDFYCSKGTKWESGFHPNDLYLKIGSTWKYNEDSSNTC